jgi:hypothetical protein
MAKKRPPSSATPASEAAPARPSITADRFIRLHRLLKLLASGPQTRANLTKRLSLDVRGFYRDLELLRQAGIPYRIVDGRYTLTIDAATALGRLPYPDPILTLGEIEQLAKGKSALHLKLKGQIDGLLK